MFLDFIARDLNMSQEKINRIYKDKAIITKLDAPVNNEDGATTFHNFVASEDYEHFENAIDKIGVSNILLNLLQKTLNKNELHVINEKLGLSTGITRSFNNIANDFEQGYTSQNISLIYKTAMKKLRKHKKILAEELFV